MDNKTKSESINIAKDKTKSAEFKVLKKEENGVIIDVEGWRMRVYFENLTDAQIEKATVGKIITIKYIGNLKDISSVKLQKLTLV